MKLDYLLVLLFMAASLASCSGPKNEESVTAVPAVKSPIEADAKGNYINPEGWSLPVTQPIETEKLTREGKYRDGKDVAVQVKSYSIDLGKEQRVILDRPSRPGGQASVITHVDELSVGGGRVFCFIYQVSPYTDEGLGYGMAVMSKIKYCDLDGDGKYELKGDGLGGGIVTVPDWVRIDPPRIGTRSGLTY